ncbi:MAG: phosphonopyruvate decarboxylase [Alphaproteobacteria bacterium]|nr:phosphonopyruvate decarboxylase [Alphaproteobacteria bacterium]
MIAAETFLDAARDRGFGFYSGVPCSYLTPFINTAIGSRALTYVGAANEGDAVAAAAGAALGGMGAVAMFQNSGLGNAVSPLTSLTWTFRLPVLLIVTWRCEPGGASDEPQHELMGRITPGMLETMDIPWRRFPSDDEAIGPALDAAEAHMAASGRPFALVMSKGSVAPSELEAQPPAMRAKPAVPPPIATPSLVRRAALTALRNACEARDVLLATTGFTGRELCAIGDEADQLYMVGSMGCIASLGLGLALAQPSRRVIAIDGDGALLMRLGVLATVGAVAPKNLVHVVIDNGMHESTGGQATVSASADLAAAAAACGYARVLRAGEAAEIAAALEAGEGPTLLHVPVRPGIASPLPRPSVTPGEVAARLKAHLAA